MQSKLIEYIDLPKIPINLLDPLESIFDKPDATIIGPAHKWWHHKVVNDNLKNFLESIFSFEIVCQYQFILSHNPVHKDVTRSFVYNYLLDTGGDDIYTNFYDRWENGNLLASEKIPVNTWVKLNVKTFHQVKGLTKERLRISVNVIPKSCLLMPEVYTTLD